jgi:galactose mutarotase-like enzyme
MELITLRADGAGLTVAPAVGGAVTRYWLERDGATREWLRPTPTEAVRDRLPHLASAFPLVPYSNRIREGRFTFHEWPESGASLALTAGPPLDYLVLFTPPGRSFFCAEPVSHVTDAFNLAHAGRADTGRQVIDPGATLETAIALIPRG